MTPETLIESGIKTIDYGNSVAELFRKLSALRNQSIHFRVDLDIETREPALEAISLLQEIVSKQFGVDGPQPWFISGIKGASYIKKELETLPFIHEFYLPACVYVGPNHKVRFENNRWLIEDSELYEKREITDEEFAQLVSTN